MQAPTRIDARSAGDYLEVMTRAVFQGGISWNVVAAKWPGIRAAFHGFDAERVADMVEPEIDRIASNPDVIRNRRKIEATVSNAAGLIEIEREFGSVGAYLATLPDFDAKVKALRKRFKFLGETGCYYFLYVVGEDVPPHDEWRRRREEQPGSVSGR
ncbi:MAG: DNA-3-methyladenine glycosylase I [Thermomicrobiales bacterium]